MVPILVPGEPQPEPGPEPPEPPAPEPGPEPTPPPPPEPEPEPDPSPEPSPSPGPPPEPPEDNPQPPPPEPESSEEFLECGALEVSCHVSNWFHGLVSDALNPLFGAIGAWAFSTPEPNASVTALWSGTLGVTNILYILLVVAGGAVVMSHESLQTRYSAREIAPRLLLGFVASNFSLWVATEMIRGANGISAAISANGIDPDEAATNLQDRMDVILQEAVVFILLLLVAAIVLLVVWLLMEVVRVVMTICLVIMAPLLLMFHALPQSQRIAALWWRSMAGVLATPIAQSIAFTAFMQLFFEGQFSYFGSLQPEDPGAEEGQGAAAGAETTAGRTVMVASRLVMTTGSAAATDGGVLFNLLLFLTLLYIQIRIPFWIHRLVWSSSPGSSLIVSVIRTAASTMLYRRVFASVLGHRGGGSGGGGGARTPPRPSAPSSGAFNAARSWRSRGAASTKNPAHAPPLNFTSSGVSGGGTSAAGTSAGGRSGPGAGPPHNPANAPPLNFGPSGASGGGASSRPGAPGGRGAMPGAGPPRNRAGAPPLNLGSPGGPSPGGAPPGGRSGRGTGPRGAAAGSARPMGAGAVPPGGTRPGARTPPRAAPGPSASTWGRGRTVQPGLFPPPPRWRQGVLPTPPPTRIPGRRATERLGDLTQDPTVAPGPVRGQEALFSVPRPPRWRQQPIPGMATRSRPPKE